MKIKNMKLMLFSLFGLMSVNAMAGDIGPAVVKKSKEPTLNLR